MDDDDRKEAETAFHDLVNMTPKELLEWLDTNESKSVGQSDDGGESTGHASGRRIVEILERNKPDYTDDDYAHMRKVVGYCKRHLAQGGPEEDIEHSRWRYSLMNWGHDPLRR